MVHSSPLQPKQHHCSSAISEKLPVQAFTISKSFENPCARNGVAAVAVEGKGVVCFCCVISWRYRFTSPVKLLPCAREIPGSSVWMHCFYTLEVLCCHVNHPVRISLRAVGLTKLGVIGCHMLGGLWEKEGLQSFSNRV